MDWLKKYWWSLLLAPVVIYFVWKYFEAKKRNAAGAAHAREAKAAKAALNGAEESLIEAE